MLYQQVLVEDRQNPGPRDYFTTIETLMAERADAEAQRQVHLDEVEKETRRIEAFDLVLASLRQKAVSDTSCDANSVDLPMPERLISAEFETNGTLLKTACGGATVADILECGTQPECLYVIAGKNKGFLDVNSAADLIIAAGKSKGRRSTVISTAHHFMSESADWQKVAPSKFKLIEYKEAPVDDSSETAIECA